MFFRMELCVYLSSLEKVTVKEIVSERSMARVDVQTANSSSRIG